MKVDMSPEAITARLEAASELRDLCIALGGDRLKQKWLESLPENIRQEVRKRERDIGNHSTECKANAEVKILEKISNTN